MPLVELPAFAGSFQTNLSATLTSGTAIITGGSANTKGSWAPLIDPVTVPAYGIYVVIRDIQVSAGIRNLLLDIGYGPTGGGNEEILIPNINGGGAAEHTTKIGGKEYFFPVYIASGTRLSCRAQGSTVITAALPGTVTVWLLQKPWSIITCGLVYDYGTDLANSRGTSVTPGNGAFGTWTQISAGTAHDHRFWSLSFDLLGDTTAIDDMNYLVELGIGPDSSNVTTIFGPVHAQEQSNEVATMTGPRIGYAPVVSGTPLWIRAATGQTEARGFMVWGMN